MRLYALVYLLVAVIFTGCEFQQPKEQPTGASDAAGTSSQHSTAMAMTPELIANDRAIVQSQIGDRTIVDGKGDLCGFDLSNPMGLTDDFIVAVISAYRSEIKTMIIDAKHLSYSIEVLPKLENLNEITIISAPSDSAGIEQLRKRGVKVVLKATDVPTAVNENQ